MIEKDFKDLLLEIEISTNDKKETLNTANLLMDTVKNNISKNIKLLYIDIYGSYKKQTNIKDEKKVDILVVLMPKNKKLPADILIKANMNEIENALIYNLKNGVLLNDNKTININRDYKESSISFTLADNIEYRFIIRLKTDELIKEINDIEIEKWNYELCFKQTNLTTILNKEYTKFITTIKILKHYLSLQKEDDFKLINNYLLELLLCYGLEKYYFDNNYCDYIKSFTYAIEDFIKGNVIEVSDQTYAKIAVKKTMTTKSKYTIIDATMPIYNLVKNIDNINAFKLFKSFLISKLPKDKDIVSIDVTPSWVIEGKTIEWKFILEGTEQKNSGGEYEFTPENNDAAILKATLKALQFVVKNKIGTNILIKSNNSGLFIQEKHTDENASRIANIKNFIDDNDLQVNYE